MCGRLMGGGQKAGERGRGEQGDGEDVTDKIKIASPTKYLKNVCLEQIKVNQSD